jgi:oligoendopeptidase F
LLTDFSIQSIEELRKRLQNISDENKQLLSKQQLLDSLKEKEKLTVQLNKTAVLPTANSRKEVKEKVTSTLPPKASVLLQKVSSTSDKTQKKENPKKQESRKKDSSSGNNHDYVYNRPSASGKGKFR